MQLLARVQRGGGGRRTGEVDQRAARDDGHEDERVHEALDKLLPPRAPRPDALGVEVDTQPPAAVLPPFEKPPLVKSHSIIVTVQPGDASATALLKPVVKRLTGSTTCGPEMMPTFIVRVFAT